MTGRSISNSMEETAKRQKKPWSIPAGKQQAGDLHETAIDDGHQTHLNMGADVHTMQSGHSLSWWNSAKGVGFFVTLQR